MAPEGGRVRTITKQEHDALVAARGRPVTDGPMRVPLREDETTVESLIDNYTKGEK
jgi:hypothetical protein